jgi:hypothetical protein
MSDTLGESMYMSRPSEAQCHLSDTEGPGILNSSTWKHFFVQGCPISEMTIVF